jgi:hypothetical protein
MHAGRQCTSDAQKVEYLVADSKGKILKFYKIRIPSYKPKKGEENTYEII